MSFDVLQKKIIEKQNPTIAGLDARVEYVPEYILPNTPPSTARAFRPVWRPFMSSTAA